MVLVDTSTWIRHLSNRLDEQDKLARLLDNEEVLGHPFVYGELLIGDTGGRAPFLAGYERIVYATVASHDEVAHFVKIRQLNGRGLAWIDAHLLASCAIDRARIWTKDLRLNQVAQEMYLAY